MERGIIVKSTGKVYKVMTDDGEITDCVITGRFRMKDIKTTNPLAVGDNVSFRKDEASSSGIITAVEERKNYIIRRSSNLSWEAQIIAANIDHAVIMVSLTQPSTPIEFIDRFLVTAEAYRVPAAIFFNKIDIYGDKERESLSQLRSLYEGIGYQTVALSVKNGFNIEKVYNLFKDSVSLLAGNSGVGKTSLLNLLSPGLKLKTGEISSYHKQGRHTTTYPEMHMMPFGGAIIDTPGIRGFGMVDLERNEIYHFFPEIFRLSTDCKYYNCLHYNEPGCAVLKALEEGEVAWTRYRSYLSILEDNSSKYR